MRIIQLTRGIYREGNVIHTKASPGQFVVGPDGMACVTDAQLEELSRPAKPIFQTNIIIDPSTRTEPIGFWHKDHPINVEAQMLADQEAALNAAQGELDAQRTLHLGSAAATAV